jgi:hypothetical protein
MVTFTTTETTVKKGLVVPAAALVSGGDLLVRERERPVVSTGFRSLDALLPAGGVRPGSLVEWLAEGDAGPGAGDISYVLTPLGAIRLWTTTATVPLVLDGDNLGITSAYTWNDPISGTTEFLTTTYADWGLTPGSSQQVTIAGTYETVTINIAPVPEPSTYAIALAGIACGGYSMFRRRK